MLRRIMPVMLACLLGLSAVWAQEPESKGPPGADTGGQKEMKASSEEKEKKEKKQPRLTIAPQSIEVTAGFQGGAVVLEPTKIVVDLDKYEASGSVDRVEDVLKNMTGIDVIQGNGGADPQQVVLMRGFDDSRYQVAIDGRPVTAPTAGSDTFVDWSSLTTGNIERIEIIRGSASARYENAVGGVINIITKKGKKGGSLVPKASSEVSYSSFNTLNTRGIINGGVGALGYFINFGSRNSDGFLRNNYWDGRDYNGRLDYAFPWKGSFTAAFKRSEIELGYPVANDPKLASYDSDYPVLSENADTLRMGRLISYPNDPSNPLSKSYKNRKKSQIDLSYNQDFHNSNLSIKYFFDRGSEDSWSYQRSSVTSAKLVPNYQGSNYVAGSASNATPGSRRERTFGVMFDYQMNFWAKHSLTIGYSHRRMDVHDTPDVYRIQGGYIEDQYALTNKLTLTMGLRYMKVREFSYAYADLGSTAKYRHLIYTNEWLPKFTATYHFNPQTEVYASINRDYHVPGC